MARAKDYQQMVFTADAYSWGVTKQEASKLMWEDISKFLAIISKNDQIAVVHEEEEGIVVIEYAHCERHDAWGIQNPHWITDDEFWKATCEEEEDEGI